MTHIYDNELRPRFGADVELAATSPTIRGGGGC
jgi:hypothetical protein